MGKYRVLEILIKSAHILNCADTKTYAKVWIHPSIKHKTPIVRAGPAGPSWNERFIFAVDQDFVDDKNSAVWVEVYGVRMGLKDKVLGRVVCPVGETEDGVKKYSTGKGFEGVNVGLKVSSEGITCIGASTSLDGWAMSDGDFLKMAAARTGVLKRKDKYWFLGCLAPLVDDEDMRRMQMSRVGDTRMKKKLMGHHY